MRCTIFLAVFTLALYVVSSAPVSDAGQTGQMDQCFSFLPKGVQSTQEIASYTADEQIQSLKKMLVSVYGPNYDDKVRRLLDAASEAIVSENDFLKRFKQCLSDIENNGDAGGSAGGSAGVDAGGIIARSNRP